MAKKVITVLEITQTHIKLAQAKEESGSNVISKFFIENISSDTDEAISKTLSDLIKKSNIKPTNLIVVIPRNLVTIRNVNLPSQDPVEIEKMVGLQAAKQIPYSKEDIIIDHLIIGKDSSGYSKILMVIAHKDAINRYLKITAGIQAKPSTFVLSSQGVFNWYQLYQNKTKGSNQDTIVLMDIDTTNTGICFVYNNQLIFSRSISFGIRDLDSGNLEDLLRQIHLTLSTYKKEKIGQEISKIVLTPSSGDIKNLAKRLEAEFSISTEVLDSQIIISGEKELSLPNQIVQCEASSSVILGFAIGRKEKLIDLLPPEVYKKQERQIKRKELVFLGILLVLVIISIMSAVFVKMYKKEQYIKLLKTSLKQTNPKAKNISQTIKKLELIKQRLNPKISSIDILYELYNLMPENISLTIFALDEQGNFSLQGVALVMSDVFTFQGLLDKSGYFSNVEVKYASKRRTRKAELTDFRIICQITK